MKTASLLPATSSGGNFLHADKGQNVRGFKYPVWVNILSTSGPLPFYIPLPTLRLCTEQENCNASTALHFVWDLPASFYLPFHLLVAHSMFFFSANRCFYHGRYETFLSERIEQRGLIWRKWHRRDIQMCLISSPMWQTENRPRSRRRAVSPCVGVFCWMCPTVQCSRSLFIMYAMISWWREGLLPRHRFADDTALYSFAPKHYKGRRLSCPCVFRDVCV